MSDGPRTYFATLRNADTGAFASYLTLLFAQNGTLSVVDSNQLVQPKPFANFTDSQGNWKLSECSCGKGQAWSGATLNFTADPVGGVAEDAATGRAGTVEYKGHFLCNYKKIRACTRAAIYLRPQDALEGREPVLVLGNFVLEGELIPNKL